MTLYELAHHPKAFKQKHLAESKEDDFWWGSKQHSTEEQFTLLNSIQPNAQDHKNENEFRMHLLFIYWSTQS